MDIVDRLVAEGKRVGKTPWCANDYWEEEAYNRLNGFPIHLSQEKFPQESMDETVRRRQQEKKIWNCKDWSDWARFDRINTRKNKREQKRRRRIAWKVKYLQTNG